jgi:hypothetical protein
VEDIKTRRLEWAGPIMSMEDERIKKDGKCHNTRHVRKPKTRWEEAILREILECENGRDEQKTERNGGVL